MRNLYAIYRKEMAHYFVSPVAYILIGVFLIVADSSLTSFSPQRFNRHFPPRCRACVSECRRISMFRERCCVRSSGCFPPWCVHQPAAGDGRVRRGAQTRNHRVADDVAHHRNRNRAWQIPRFAHPLRDHDLPTAILLGFMNFRSEPHPPWRMLRSATRNFAAGRFATGARLAYFFVDGESMIAGVLTFASAW